MARACLRWLAIWLFCACVAESAPKIALIAGPAEQTAAEILATALEQQDDVTLTAGLSGDEARVATLAGLAAAGRFADLARELDVDGLIRLTAEGGDAIDVQLIPRGTGIAVAAFRDALPIANTETWSHTAMRIFDPMLGKLTSTTDHATPVSIVQFYAPPEIPNAEEVSRAVTLRLVLRLSHEPALVIYERVRLAEFGEGRERFAASSGKFWDRRWIIDGTIAPDPADPAQLVIKFRLRSPGGGLRAEFIHACAPTGVTDVLNTFTAEFLDEIGELPGNTPWEPEREAARWLLDARWYATRELWPHAAVAAESSWALGAREPELVAVRVRAANHAIPAPYLLRPAMPDHFVGRFLTARAAITAQWEGSPAAAAIAQLTNAEKIRAIESARRAHEILRRGIDFLPAEGRNALGTETTAYAATVLDWSQRAGDAEAFQDGLAELRRALRENIARILLGTPNRRALDDLFCLSAFLHPLWQESPEDALAAWQVRLAEPWMPGQIAVLRVALLHSRHEFPRFVPLAGVTKPRADALWEKLTLELEESKRIEDRLAGFALHHDLAVNQTLRATLARKIRDALFDLRERFIREPSLFRLFSFFRATDGAAPEIDLLSLGEPRKLPVASAVDRDFVREFALLLLRESNDIAWAAIEALIRPEDYDEAQAAEVLAALAAHRERIPAESSRAGIDLTREKILARFPKLQP